MNGMRIKLKGGETFTPNDESFTVTNEGTSTVKIRIKTAFAEKMKDGISHDHEQ